MIKFVENKLRTGRLSEYTDLFTEDKVKKIHKFHKSLEHFYNVTRLEKLDALAHDMGIFKLYIKNESRRGNFNAFKLLGGSYAVANIIYRKLGLDIGQVGKKVHKKKENLEMIKSLTFAAASDGNHGKSVAWAANILGAKSIVYMPKGTAEERIEAIEKLGGEVVVTDLTYDGCVSLVSKLGKEKGWEVVLDTATDGDPQVASWVMEGYATMAREVIKQLRHHLVKPTHVFLQAGVGSMAASVIATLANEYYPDMPKFYIVEPHQANCFYQSGKAQKPVSVEGNLDSISAGLSCGVVNPQAWNIIKDFADGFISSDDYLAANGMRILGNPLDMDPVIVSGESGAITTGVLEKIVRTDLKDKLELNDNSVVLLFSTEGATDRENYRNVVWYGKYNEGE